MNLGEDLLKMKEDFLPAFNIKTEKKSKNDEPSDTRSG